MDEWREGRDWDTFSLTGRIGRTRIWSRGDESVTRQEKEQSGIKMGSLR